MTSQNRRIEMDVRKLLMSDFDAALVNDNLREFYVCLPGPEDSPYEGGLWKLHVELPEQYPYKSPSIGFETKIFHPNIDESSGSVCLDVINQTWSPMFTLIHVFETFIPQLLNYPNAADPLNGDASSLYLNNREKYIEKVKEYVVLYANKEKVLKQFCQKHGIESDLDDENEDEDDDYGDGSNGVRGEDADTGENSDTDKKTARDVESYNDDNIIDEDEDEDEEEDDDDDDDDDADSLGMDL